MRLDFFAICVILRGLMTSTKNALLCWKLGLFHTLCLTFPEMDYTLTPDLTFDNPL